MTEDFDTARDLFTAGGRVEGEIFAPILIESKRDDLIWFSSEISAFHPELIQRSGRPIQRQIPGNEFRTILLYQ